MSAQALLDALARDDEARLKWVVLRRLGLCPAALSARLLSRRRVLALACQLALEDAGSAAPALQNPGFDMARFRALRAAGDGEARP